MVQKALSETTQKFENQLNVWPWNTHTRASPLDWRSDYCTSATANKVNSLDTFKRESLFRSDNSWMMDHLSFRQMGH